VEAIKRARVAAARQNYFDYVPEWQPFQPGGYKPTVIGAAHECGVAVFWMRFDGSAGLSMFPH